MAKVLIIRFSSIGDMAQCAHVIPQIRAALPQAEIHWLARSDFSAYIDSISQIDRVWSFERKVGLTGLWHLAKRLKTEHFTHVYDAHNNLRSHLVVYFLRLLGQWSFQFTRRSKFRWKRYLLFSWRRNLFPQPFIGAMSFSDPLTNRWHWPKLKETPCLPGKNKSYPSIDAVLPQKPFVALAPSAAWSLKRWPIDHWMDLIHQLKDQSFVLLGGPDDDFCDDIAKVAPARIVNLSGKLSWLESAYVIGKSQALVSGDTGVLHMADLQGQPTVAIIGPTAFGFPFRSKSKILEIPLPCRPCTKDGRGQCRISETQKCLTKISPKMVIQALNQILPLPPARASSPSSLTSQRTS